MYQVSLVCSTGRLARQYATERGFHAVAEFLEQKEKEQAAAAAAAEAVPVADPA